MKSRIVPPRAGLFAAAIVTIVLSTVAFTACGGKSSSSSTTTTTANPTAGAPAPTNPIANRKPIPASTPQPAGTTYPISQSFEHGAPIMDGNFADPFVLVVGNMAYAYASNVPGINIPAGQADTTTEMGTLLGDVLPKLPASTSPRYV